MKRSDFQNWYGLHLWHWILLFWENKWKLTIKVSEKLTLEDSEKLTVNVDCKS